MSSSPVWIRLQARRTNAQGMKEEDMLFRYKGVLYSIIASPRRNLKAMEELEAREDDVILAAYPKCGSNWMAAVLLKIMASATGEKQNRKAPLPMEFFDPEMQQMLAVFRNPKDTAVSYYHFSKKSLSLPTPDSWDAFYTQFMSGDVAWGSYFDHALAWEKRIEDPNVMIVTYEDLKEDLCKGVQQISQFFDFKLTEEQIQSIAQDSTFDAMKESAKDTHGQLANMMFRKGVVGDWKNLFSEAQSEKMDAEFERRLAGTKLGARMKYDLYCK